MMSNWKKRSLIKIILFFFDHGCKLFQCKLFQLTYLLPDYYITQCLHGKDWSAFIILLYLSNPVPAGLIPFPTIFNPVFFSGLTVGFHPSAEELTYPSELEAQQEYDSKTQDSIKDGNNGFINSVTEVGYFLFIPTADCNTYPFLGYRGYKLWLIAWRGWFCTTSRDNE